MPEAVAKKILQESPFRWSVVVRVERVGCPEATREVTAAGDLMAPIGRGAAFGVVALRRAMHASSQQVAAQIRELTGGTS